MSESRVGWRRNPFILGPLVGWLIGIFWCVGLMIAFGPSTVVTSDGEHTITVLSRLRYAPVAAIPWAVTGLIIGCFTAATRSRWVAASACVGLVAGGIGAIAGNPLDGWLAIMMPLCCLGGAFGGALAAVAVIAVWRLVRHGQVE